MRHEPLWSVSCRNTHDAISILFQTELYWINPQYFIELVDMDEEDEDETCTLVVSLMQKHARMRRTIERKESCEASLGIDVFKVKAYLIG